MPYDEREIVPDGTESRPTAWEFRSRSRTTRCREAVRTPTSHRMVFNLVSVPREGNALSDFVYSGGSFVATGILVVGSRSANVQENTVGNTQGGIVTASIPGSDADKTKIHDNWIFGTVSTADGIDVCSNRNKVL